MFGSTYAVSWNANGSRCAGRLDIGDYKFVLTGSWNGCRSKEAIAFGDIADVRVKDGLLCVTRRDGSSLSIRNLDAPGALRELAERLAVRAA